MTEVKVKAKHNQKSAFRIRTIIRRQDSGAPEHEVPLQSEGFAVSIEDDLIMQSTLSPVTLASADGRGASYGRTHDLRDAKVI